MPVISVSEVLKKQRFLRVALIGEPDSGKTSTSGTLTPGAATCVICTAPVSQMIVHDPATRVYEPANFKETVEVLKDPAKVFGKDIGTLVWDDATFTISRALEEKGILKESDPRRVYKDVQFTLEGALIYTIKQPFHFVIIAQARRMVSEISGLDEITLDVPPSMENSLVAAVDYAFFLSREKKPDAAPSLAVVPVKRTVTKVKLTREQFGKSPLAQTEPADLAAIWAKLNNTTGEKK